MNLSSVLDSLAESTAALEAVVPSIVQSDDATLIANQGRLAEARRRIDAAVAVSSAEMERRSHRDLGYAGLAQRLGARTPERLVQTVSGVSKREASILLRVGAMLESAPDSPLTAPIARGQLSIEAAEVIRAGLGEPSPTASPEALARAEAQLASEAPTLTIERLAARARELRDLIDETGIAEREEQRRERRFLRLIPQWDGMVRVTGLLDPESAALVTDAFDAVTSPRRGGPRFVAAEDKKRAAAIEHDPRTTEQIMLDTFVEIVKVAVAVDPGTMFGSRKPSVRIVVTDTDLHRGSGAGHLEGQTATVSIATVQRHACDGGVLEVQLGRDGQVYKPAAPQRLFSAAQRVALAIRDGGCRFGDCDRPPSWTEAHHVTFWSKGGATSVANGILLCKFHHLLVHNNHWNIHSDGVDFWLEPPASVDPERRRIPMPSKSATMRWIAAERAAERPAERSGHKSA